MENVLVCADGSCGQCMRCQFLATSKAAVATMLAERRGIEFLSNLRKEGLRTIAESLEEGSTVKVGLMQLVDMTTEQALEMMAPVPPDTSDGQ